MIMFTKVVSSNHLYLRPFYRLKKNRINAKDRMDQIVGLYFHSPLIKTGLEFFVSGAKTIDNKK